MSQHEWRHQIVLAIGDSNMVGVQGEPYDVRAQAVDAPHPRVLEISRGVPRERFFVAPVGESMVMREPCQDDVTGGMGPKLTMGKCMVQRAPAIERVAFYCAAIDGSGFSNGIWNPGDESVVQLVASVAAFVQHHPHFRVTCIAVSLGAADGIAGWSGPAFEVAVTSLAAHLRTTIPGAGQAAWVHATVEPTLAGSAEVVEMLAPIQASIRRIGEWLDNAGHVEMESQAGTLDGRHFDVSGYRFMGSRLAEVTLALEAANEEARRVGSVHLRYDASIGAFADVLGGATRIFNGVYEEDELYGWILRSDGSPGGGFDTDVPMPSGAYTKFCRVSVERSFNASALLLGRHPTQSADGHYWDTRAISHDLSAGISPVGLEGQLSLRTWYAFALTWNGAEFRLYLDGALVPGFPKAAGATALGEDQVLQIGRWGVSEGSADAKYTDIRVAPYAATAEEIAAWSAPAPLAPNP